MYLGVDIGVLVSDVLNLGGDVGVLVLDVRDLGVDIGDLVADVLVLGADRSPWSRQEVGPIDMTVEGA